MKIDKKILNIIRIVISIILCVATGLCFLTSVMTKVQRDYLSSEELENRIEAMNPDEIVFEVDDEKVTLKSYLETRVGEYVGENLPKFSGLSGIAIDAVLSSDTVAKFVRSQLMEVIDYVLNSDVDDAKQRVENNTSVVKNKDFNPYKADGIEDFVKRIIKVIMIEYVEDMSKTDFDEIIVMMSEETIEKYETISIVLLIILIAINLKKIENAFLYGAISLSVAGIGIKFSQYKFLLENKGNEDLASYIFIKPYMDSIGEKATIILLVSLVLIIIFICLVIFGDKLKALFPKPKK